MARSKDRQAFQDVSSYSGAEGKKRRRGRRVRLALQCVACFLCVVMILFGSALIYISTDVISELSTTTITRDPDLLGIKDDAIVNSVHDDSITNIAMFGVDSRNSEFRGLSDVVMVLTVDNRHNTVKMTSILRDSLVYIEGDGYGGGYYNEYNKINAAYSWGGPELAIRTLNQNFGLRIEDYVTVNFVNMAAIVDAFGGVEMEVTYDEIDEINTNLFTLMREVEDQMSMDYANGVEGVDYPQVVDSDFMSATGDTDTYLLNGNQAVSYGRIRNIGSDFARVDRQQKVLSALIDRVKIFGVAEYPNLVKKLAPYVQTSLSIDDVISMLPILATDLSVERITMPDYEAETDLHDVNYDLVYDLENAAKRMSAFMFEELSPYWDEYQEIVAKTKK